MLFLDRRLGSREFYPRLRALGVPTRLVDLKEGSSAADASFSGNGPDGRISVGVEIKRVTEIADVGDTRFAGRQLGHLVSRYSVPVLLIWGSWKVDENGEVTQWRSGRYRPISHGGRAATYRVIDGRLNTLALVCGLTIKRAADVHEAACQLANLYRWFRKPWDAHRSHEVAHFKEVGLPRGRGAWRPGGRRPGVVWAMAAQLPGIANRGEEVERAYPRIADFGGLLAVGTETDWQRIKGVGKKGARDLVKLIHGERE